MTTAGAKLVDLSSLSIGTAAAHLFAITTGSGTPADPGPAADVPGAIFITSGGDVGTRSKKYLPLVKSAVGRRFQPEVKKLLEDVVMKSEAGQFTVSPVSDITEDATISNAGTTVAVDASDDAVVITLPEPELNEG